MSHAPPQNPSLAGVLPVFQTPYHDDFAVDFETLGRELDWLLSRGADGVVMGMVSETLRLTDAERREVAEFVCAHAAVRGVASVISVGAESSLAAAGHARHAAACGATAVMAIPPISVALGDGELLGYYTAIFQAAAPLPVVVQDASGYVGRPMSLSFQAALLDRYGPARALFKPEAAPIGPRLSALRDATGARAAIFEGSGGVALVDSYRRGIVGTMPGADLIDAVVALWRALRAGDDRTAYRISLPLSALVTLQGNLDSFFGDRKAPAGAPGGVPQRTGARPARVRARRRDPPRGRPALRPADGGAASPVIVDIHSHAWAYPAHFSDDFRRQAARARRGVEVDLTVRYEDYAAAAPEGVVTVVFGGKARRSGLWVDDQYVADYVARRPDRLIGFMSLDPTQDGWEYEMRAGREDLALSGIKLLPMYAGFSPDDTALDTLWRYAAGRGLPVLLHTGTTFVSQAPLDCTLPRLLDRVAIRHPDVKIILAHLAHPYEAECVAVIRKHPNLFADISALHYRPFQLYHSLMLVQEYGVWDKLLFGTDYPFTNVNATIDGLRSLNGMLEGTALPRLDPAEIEKLIHRDALQLLGLPRPGVVR